MNPQPIPSYIPPLLRSVLLPLLRSQIIPRIPGVIYQNLASAAAEALVVTTEKLADNNPNNGEQIAEVWKNFAAGHAIPTGESLVEDFIEGVNDTIARQALEEVQPLLSGIAYLLVDSDSDNATQVKEYLKDYYSDVDRIRRVLNQIVAPLAVKLGVNETIVQAILPFLETVIIGFLTRVPAPAPTPVKSPGKVPQKPSFQK